MTDGAGREGGGGGGGPKEGWRDGERGEERYALLKEYGSE